ncbi:hypothetical protein JKF63_00554 [Porcisia hertigi]|uniref:EF-hand domain-containing protein n=1 Tax=Porcisia hertigi TaxID=2761500 RepID=A0A836HFB4_9TRYP|nr:hypothetical protein JKF63_00554 [Porcisia hertigi]
MSVAIDAVGSAPRAAAESHARLYDCLDAASKERVTMLLSHYEVLLPVEQDAFMQELERYNHEQSAAALARRKAGETWIRYTTPRLRAVQARDPAYVQRLISDKAASNWSNSDEAPTEATPPCTLEDLLYSRGVFEDAGQAIHVRKMTLYEKLHQNMNSHSVKPSKRATHDPTTSVPAVPNGSAGTVRQSVSFEDPVEEKAEPFNQESQTIEATSLSAEMQAESSKDAAVMSVSDGNPPPSHASSTTLAAPYRNNAYQAVRLAMSFPAYTARTPPPSPSSGATAPLPGGVKRVWNVSSFPITEDELREWFEELDVTGRGALNLDEFMHYMESLERDFGVSTEYATLKQDGERLAKDGKLSFEAFSYLVLRFVRFG